MTIKVPPFLFLVLLIRLLQPRALFVSALKDDRNSKDDEVIKVSPSVRGAATNVSQKDFGTNPASVVASYFENDDDAASTGLRDTIRQMANDEDMHEFLLATRRSLHKHPQVMYQESFASQTIQTILDELDIKYTTGWAKNTHENVYKGKGGYGVVAHIGTGDKSQPCIILRADMDALPIKEATEGIDAFKSENEGQMHAW